MNGKRETAGKRVQPLLDAVSGVARVHPGLRVEEFGAASAGHALDTTIGRDFSRAESLSIPLLAILLLAFGALIAAFSAGDADGDIADGRGEPGVPRRQLREHVMLLIGLAVGVDY